MRVLHSSDLHGKYKRLLSSELDFDLWLDTGDFLDNQGRKPRTGYTIAPQLERVYQARLIAWKDLTARFRRWLDGRPAILVPGNHDFSTFGRHLLASGCPNVHVITPAGVQVAGLRWAGFREVPYMAGEWRGELQEPQLQELVDQTWLAPPDVLVTHAPAAGRLDKNSSGQSRGIHCLGQALKAPGPIRNHFFGHAHFQGGQVLEQDGVRSINGATGVAVHEVEV